MIKHRFVPETRQNIQTLEVGVVSVGQLKWGAPKEKLLCNDGGKGL